MNPVYYNYSNIKWTNLIIFIKFAKTLIVKKTEI